MTPASRRTGRAAALSVAVSLATALLAAACSAPPTHHAQYTGSGDTTGPLLDGGIDRGIHVPGTVPNDHLTTVPDTTTPHHRHHHTTAESAAGPDAATATTTASRHPRTAHPRHARTRRRVWTTPHHRTPTWHRLHTAHHPAASTTAAPPRTPTTTKQATNQAANQAARPAAQPATKPATKPAPAALLPATDHRPLWIGTPAEHVAPVGQPTGSTQPIHPIPGTGDVVIPVTVPAAEGPLRPDTVLSGPGYRVDLRQRPTAPAPGTAAPLTR